jgi:hypothetical protein
LSLEATAPVLGNSVAHVAAGVQARETRALAAARCHGKGDALPL